MWLTLIDTFCDALRDEFPTTRRKRTGGDAAAGEEHHSDKIDEINERLARLAVEGRWESFNIPGQGEYLPDHTDAQVGRLAEQGPDVCRDATHCGEAHPPAPALLTAGTPPAVVCAQAGEHRNVQQIFPFAVEGIFASDPEKDWPTEVFITWLELMVRPTAFGRPLLRGALRVYTQASFSRWAAGCRPRAPAAR